MGMNNPKTYVQKNWQVGQQQITQKVLIPTRASGSQHDDVAFLQLDLMTSGIQDITGLAGLLLSLLLALLLDTRGPQCAALAQTSDVQQLCGKHLIEIEKPISDRCGKHLIEIEKPISDIGTGPWYTLGSNTRILLPKSHTKFHIRYITEWKHFFCVETGHFHRRYIINKAYFTTSKHIKQ